MIVALTGSSLCPSPDRVPSRAAEHFSEDYDGRSLPWAKPVGAPTAFETERILLGNGDNAFEVALTDPFSARRGYLTGLRGGRPGAGRSRSQQRHDEVPGQARRIGDLNPGGCPSHAFKACALGH